MANTENAKPRFRPGDNTDYADYNDDADDRRCTYCNGEQFAECDGDCPESDDCGCPYARGHYIRCPNCHGSGLAKDMTFW